MRSKPLGIVEHVLTLAKTRFPLPLRSTHGLGHWERVRENGLKLARKTDADTLLVQSFAYLHDCCREDDFSDPEHGPRAAVFLIEISGELALAPERPTLLYEAIRDHTEVLHHRNPTIATCWDADRLDIGRVGKKPQERFLSTAAARDPAVMRWAYQRSPKP